MGQDNKFWEDWEKKYGKPPITPEVPVEPVEPVTYAPSQFSLGAADPARFGPPAELQGEVLQAPGVSTGWEEWEQRFRKTAGAPVAQQPVQPVPSPTAPPPEGQGGFLDWASGVGGIFPQGKWSPFDVEGWKKAGKLALGDVMKVMNVLDITDTGIVPQYAQQAWTSPMAVAASGLTPGGEERIEETREAAISVTPVGQWLDGRYGDVLSPANFNTMVQDLAEMTAEQSWKQSAAFGLASPFNLIPIPVLDNLFGLALRGIWKGAKIPFKAKQFLFKTKAANIPKVTITPEELAAREVIERPGHVDTGEVDAAAQKVADLTARAKPGEVKFAYIDPETGEFKITLLPEELADDASRVGLGERIVNDNEIFVSEYRARVKLAAEQAADVPVTAASVVPEAAAPRVRVVEPEAPAAAAPRVRVISDVPEEVAFEIRVVEEAIQELTARADLSDISQTFLDFIGKSRQSRVKWRDLFFEIENNAERVFPSTLIKFFIGAQPAPGKGYAARLVDWAERTFPGSFREGRPRNKSTVKYDVLDDKASEWNETLSLNAGLDAAGKVYLDDVLARIKAIYSRVEGTAEYERLLRLQEEELVRLNDSPAGQVLKGRAEAAAGRASPEELAALVEHPEDMLRFLRDMVAQETHERPGFLSEEFLARFDETVDELTVLAAEADLSDSIDILIGIKDLDPARLLDELDSIISGIGTTPGVRLEDLPPAAAAPEPTPLQIATGKQQTARAELGQELMQKTRNDSNRLQSLKIDLADLIYDPSIGATYETSLRPRRPGDDPGTPITKERLRDMADLGIKAGPGDELPPKTGLGRRFWNDLNKNVDEAIKKHQEKIEKITAESPFTKQIEEAQEIIDRLTPAPAEAAPAPGVAPKFGDKQSVGPRSSMTTVDAVETVDPNVRYELYIADEGQPDHMIRLVDGDTGQAVSATIYPADEWTVNRISDKYWEEVTAARRGAAPVVDPTVPTRAAPASSYTPTAKDLEEMRMSASEWAAQDTGADIWRMADGSAPETGKPVTITTFSGSGRATREEVYARGVTGPILGDGFYGALSADAASKYGPDVTQYELTLHNPLVITSTPELQAAIGMKESLSLIPGQRVLDLQKAMISGGHDGIIVNVPRYADANDAGQSVKRIRELFDETQVFTLDPPRGGTQVRGAAAAPVPETGLLPDHSVRIAEIDAELASLDARAKALLARQSRPGQGMVPPPIKSSAFDSLARQMDKLDAEKATLLAEMEPPAAAAPETGPTMAPRTAVQTGLEGFEVPGQQVEMIIGGTDVAKPQGLINPQEEAIRQENIQLVTDGQMQMGDGLPEVMAANEGQHVDGPLRYDSTTARQYNGTDLNRGDLVTDGAALYRVERVSGFMLNLDELHPSGDPLRVVRQVSVSVDPGDVDRYVDIYRHDPSKPVGGGGSSGWAADLGDGVAGEIPNQPRDIGPDGMDPQAPPIPPGILGRLKGLFSSPGNDGGIYLANPRSILEHMDEVAEADELTQFLFKYVPFLDKMNPSVRRQDPVARLITRLFQTQVEDDSFINVAVAMAYDAHANVLTGKMNLPINWRTGQWTHGKWDEVTQGPRPLWYDVFSMYKTKYAHLVSDKHARLITDYLFVIDDEVERIRELFGLPARQKRRPENVFFVPRKGASWTDADGRITEFERPSDPNMPRLDLTATEIWQRFNVNFLTDPRAVMELHIRQALREIRIKEFNEALEGMGAVVTYKDILAATNPELIALRGAKFGEWEAAKKAVRAAVRALQGEELQTRIGKIMADVTQESKIDGIFSEAQIARRLEREGIRTSLAENIAQLKVAEREARDSWYEVRTMYRDAVEKIKKAEYVNLQGDGVHLFGGMMKEGKHKIDANQFKNKFSLSQDFKSVKEVITTLTPGGDQANIWYKMLFEQPANVVRTATSTFDLVLPFTHLMPLFGENPVKWAQALGIHYASMLAPGLQSKLVRWNLNDYWDLAVNGVSVGDPEVFAMMTPGQGINIEEVFKKWQRGRPAMGATEEKAYEWFRGAQHLTRQGMVLTVGRAQAAYQGALGYGRVLLKQAVEESWDGTNSEMYSHIRNMTGALDSKRLGVSANQRAVESMWLAFSPRLLRSTVAVTHSALSAIYKMPAGAVGRNVPVGDIPVVGGVAARALGTGANAQQRRAFLALSRLAAGITSIYITTGWAMGKDWEKDIKPGLNPLNGRRFLSYYVNGDWYGVGGQFRALMQLTWSLYGSLSGKSGEWRDLMSINLDKNPFFYFYQTRGAMGMQWGGAVIEGLSKPMFGVQLDVLPFDDIDGPSGLWDWAKTAAWPFSAQQYLESGTWGSVAWSGTVGRVTANPRDRAVAYITKETSMEQNVWSEAEPWLRAFANEHVMTGTSFEDVEMQRRYSLIQLPTSGLEYDDWDDIDGDAGALRKWLSQDIEFDPPDVNDPDPNKSALAQYYKLFNSPNYIQKGTPRGDIVLPDTPQTGATWLSNQQAVLASEWTPEQLLHVQANTNLRPVPWFVVAQFPTSKKAQMIVASQSAREKILIDAGHPELALIHRNVFYMTPFGQSLGPEMDKYLADMPPKIGFGKAEEMTGYLTGTRDIVEQRNLAPDLAPVGGR